MQNSRYNLRKLSGRKLCSEDGETAETPPGCKHLTQPLQDQAHSPSLTRSGQELGSSLSSTSATRKRKGSTIGQLPPSKRVRRGSEPAHESSPVDKWLFDLPITDQFEALDNPVDLKTMSQPPSKSLQPTELVTGSSPQSGSGSEGVFPMNKKYAVYRSADYISVLADKGSHMCSSSSGMADEDRKLCDKLLTKAQTLPVDVLFDDDHHGLFLESLEGRSEVRLCTDLHPRIMPSVENLYTCGRGQFDRFIEGFNDPWIKSISFHGPRPQPDHTIGFKPDSFSTQQRQKLGISTTVKSLYAARGEIYFPFLTGEVKCGHGCLDLANSSNAHSMTVAQRGIVDLYRKANRANDVHRRVLGFSISHDNEQARLYAHYPEIDGDNTTYWRTYLKQILFRGNEGRDRWICYRFTLNVCELFALPLLERLKSLIDSLPDRTPENSNTQRSQNGASADDDTGSNVELRSLIQSLQRQLEQQRKDSEQQRKDLQQQLEQQRKDSEQQRKDLQQHLEQQRKDSEQQLEQQRKDSEQQRKELIQLLSSKMEH